MSKDLNKLRILDSDLEKVDDVYLNNLSFQ